MVSNLSDIRGMVLNNTKALLSHGYKETPRNTYVKDYEMRNYTVNIWLVFNRYNAICKIMVLRKDFHGFFRLPEPVIEAIKKDLSYCSPVEQPIFF